MTEAIDLALALLAFGLTMWYSVGGAIRSDEVTRLSIGWNAVAVILWFRFLIMHLTAG